MLQRLHTFFRLAVETLNPWDDDASRSLFAIIGGIAFDPSAELMRLGGWLRFGLWPNDEYHPSVIPLATRLLGLPVYRPEYETPASYAEGLATIAARWALHAASGTPGGLVAELARIGLADPVIVENGLTAPYPSSFTLQSSAFGPGTDWGAGDWDTFTWDVSGVELADAKRYADCIEFWRPARSYCVQWEEAP